MKKLAIKKENILDIAKGTLFSLIISMVLVLVFALIVNLAGVGDKTVSIVNHFIKAISILVGCFLGIKTRVGGAVKGALIGLLYTLFSFIIFSWIDGAFDLSWMTLIDVLLGTVIGLISGIIVVNLRRK